MTALTELRHAFRTCVSRPKVSAAVVLLLALATSGVTSVAAVGKRILLDPLPYPEADRLVRVTLLDPVSRRTPMVRYAEFVAWRSGSISFDALEVFSTGRPTLQNGEVAEALDVAYVGSGFLRILGIQPLAGRAFLPEEFSAGHHNVALLTYPAWQRLFNGRQDALGHVLTIDNTNYTVVGILPETDYEYPRSPFGVDAWLPFATPAASDGNRGGLIVGRLKRDASIHQATEELAAMSVPLAAERPAMAREAGVVVTSLQDDGSTTSRSAIMLLLSALLVILFIACVNVANLLLARTEDRRRDLATMMALGLGTAGVARHLLLVNFLLTSAGAAMTLVLAPWFVQLFISIYPDRLPRSIQSDAIFEIAPFAILAAIGVGAVAALPSLISVLRRLSLEALHTHERTTTAARATLRMRAAFVVGQIALSLILVSAGVQFARAFAALAVVDPGYDESVMAFSMGMVQRDRSPERATQFFGELVDVVARQPGIEAAAATSHLPIHRAGGPQGAPIQLAGADVRADAPTTALWSAVTPSFVRVMGLRVLRGRDLDDTDANGSEPVALINARLAQLGFGSVDVVGRSIDWGGQRWTIAGVVNDITQSDPSQPSEPAFYVSWKQRREPPLFMLVKSSLDPNTLGQNIRQALAEVDRQKVAPVHTMATLAQRRADLTRRERFSASTTTAIAVLGMLLVVLGIYGNFSYAVTSRRTEIAVRLALGSEPAMIRRRFVLQAMTQAALGIVLGVLGVALTSGWLRANIVGFSPNDYLSVALASMFLTILAALAAWWPARSASRLDPAEILRSA